MSSKKENDTRLSRKKLFSPSAERNKAPIWDVISKILPSVAQNTGRGGEASFVDEKAEQQLRVLEIAAGCGVHTNHFMTEITNAQGDEQKAVPMNVKWFPTDPEESSRESINQWIQENPNEKVQEYTEPSRSLTLGEDGVMEGNSFGDDLFQLMVCINMIHISPWTSTVGLMRFANEKLIVGGALYCYGPYKVGGTAVESNLNFDQSLKSRDPSWGLRNLEEVVKLAEENGLRLERKIEMPANNLSLIFQKL